MELILQVSKAKSFLSVLHFTDTLTIEVLSWVNSFAFQMFWMIWWDEFGHAYFSVIVIRNESLSILSVQLYLIEETVVSYLDVRRRVRDSLKHVYTTHRPKVARCPMGPEEKERETIIIIINIILFLYFFPFLLSSTHKLT